MQKIKVTYVGMFLFAVLSVISGCGGTEPNKGSTDINLSPSGSLSVASTVQQNSSVPVSATFLDAAHRPVAGVEVSFTSTLGTLNPADGIALTNSNGTARVQLQLGGVTGSGVITATATVDGKQMVQKGTFEIALPELSLSPVTLALATLPYGGSTEVQVTVLDQNGLTYTDQPVDVSFDSLHATAGTASITRTATTVNGIARATYRAITNTGTDTITVSIANAPAVTKAIAVNPLDAQSISFVSATPENIGLKGMSGIGKSEISIVTFKVLDSLGQPKSDQAVEFTLNTNVGGLDVVNDSASSDGNGLVSTVVKSGTIATPVRVTATLKDTTISTQSDLLTVSTGVPAQDSFSLAITTFNPEAYSYDGVTDLVTVRLSDHFHNPVPDGTAVYFTTSGGSIEPSCLIGLNKDGSKGTPGVCSVTWSSQNPRPQTHYDPVNDVTKNAGRARILAYAIGEEAFLDINGNGVADINPQKEFTDDPEAYRDDNENRQHDPGYETFIDFNRDGVPNGPDGFYTGVLQGDESAGKTMSKHIFANGTIVMSTSYADISSSLDDGVVHVGQGGSSFFTVYISDLNGNVMPVGTTVSFSISTLDEGVAYKLLADSFSFPNSTADVGVTLPVFVGNPGVAETDGRKYATSGLLTIKVTTPAGNTTTATYPVLTP